MKYRFLFVFSFTLGLFYAPAALSIGNDIEAPGTEMENVAQPEYAAIMPNEEGYGNNRHNNTPRILVERCLQRWGPVFINPGVCVLYLLIGGVIAAGAGSNWFGLGVQSPLPVCKKELREYLRKLLILQKRAHNSAP